MAGTNHDVGFRFIDYRYNVEDESRKATSLYICFVLYFVVHHPIKVYSRFSVSFGSCITILSQHNMMHRN